MDNIFEQATRQKLRFNVNGSVSTEQLWDRKLFSALEEYEQTLTEVCESYAKTTRRNRINRTVEQQENELRLAIVTHILNVFEQEEKEEREKAKNKKDNESLLELIQRKKLEELQSKSVAELEAMLK